MSASPIQPEEVASAFGRALFRVRTERGLSQEALAEAADLHRTYVSFLQRGLKQPSLTTVLRLARALKVAPTLLVGEVDRSLK